MSMLEDQLRTALSARAEAVTESMLTGSLTTLEADPLDADLQPGVAPVLLLPPHRSDRPRRLVAAALSAAAMLLVAFGAVALHQATNTHQLDAAEIRPRSAIPWHKVGDGWMLQVAQPGSVDVPGGTAGWLYLIDPGGVPYRICKVPDSPDYLFSVPSTWGQPNNIDHVVMWRPIDDSRSSLLEIDLRSGVQHTVTTLGHWSTAEYLDAASILLNGGDKMVRVNATTGAIEARFEGSYFYGDAISPDRTLVVTGSETALSVLDVATGRIVRTLANPSGYNFCFVNSWLPGTTRFVARCQQIAAPHLTRRIVYSVASPGPPTPPAAPAGWDAIQLAGGDVGIKTSEPSPVDLDQLAFAQLSPGGQVVPIAVPEGFKQGDWRLEYVTPTGFVIEKVGPDGFTDEQALWNPLTGRVQVLFRTAGKGGPDGGWAGWRTSLP